MLQCEPYRGFHWFRKTTKNVLRQHTPRLDDRLCKYAETTKESYEVHHVSYSEWPDHTAPLDPTPTVSLLKLVRSLGNGNPIVVHCSGGIGRVDYISQKVKENSKVKMVDMLKDLRNQRFQGVKTVTTVSHLISHMCYCEIIFQARRHSPSRGKVYRIPQQVRAHAHTI
ncbi:Protein-tyrosine phosphatase [Cooperia oncophora]